MDEKIIARITSIVVKEVMKELRAHPIKWNDEYEDPEGEDDEDD
ncbi:MAG: hypothetical protein Q8M94_08740 [Ignavibacteria bacterium]|nr:hypothetical protein [Ignavibacteria bacterium]